MKIGFNFLKPRLLNMLLTIVIFSLPILQEKARFPEGGYELAHYRPISLLTSYLQTQEWYPFFLMVGLFVVIYFGVSVVVAVATLLWKKIGK